MNSMRVLVRSDSFQVKSDGIKRVRNGQLTESHRIVIVLGGESKSICISTRSICPHRIVDDDP